MDSSTYLHLVDVGGMVPATAEVNGCFTAAIRNEPLILLDPHTVRPIRGVVTAATLKLRTVQRGTITQKHEIMVTCRLKGLNFILNLTIRLDR